MNQVIILNVRKGIPGFIPMEEAFLASALKVLGTRDIEIRSVLPHQMEACVQDIARRPADTTRVLLWESASYKSCQSLLDYFRLAGDIRAHSGVFLAAGGYWASTLTEAYPVHFQPFDLVLSGFALDKAAQAFDAGTKGGNPLPAVDVSGPCDWNAYELDLSPISTLETYVGNGYVSGYRTTFGCPKNCYFCYNNMLRNQGARYFERDLEKIERDVQSIMEKYDNAALQIKDRNFFCNKKRAFAVIDMLRSMGVTITSNLDITVNDAQEDIFAKCRDSGVNSMFFGLESLHQESLERFNKTYPLAKLEKLFEYGDKYEITLNGCLLLGLPWQTAEIIREDVRKAFTYMNDFKFLRINFNNYHPLIDTAVQQQYFPDVADKLSLEELHEVYNFRATPEMQHKLYGPAFDGMNFEKLRMHALALNSISLLEHYHIPEEMYWLLSPIKELIRDNVMKSSEDNIINKYLTADRIVEIRRSITRISIELKKVFGMFQRS